MKNKEMRRNQGAPPKDHLDTQMDERSPVWAWDCTLWPRSSSAMGERSWWTAQSAKAPPLRSPFPGRGMADWDFHLRVCLLPIMLACSRLRRSPVLFCGVEKCASRIFPHNTLNFLCGEAARAPGERAKTLRISHALKEEG